MNSNFIYDKLYCLHCNTEIFLNLIMKMAWDMFGGDIIKGVNFTGVGV